MSRAFFVATLCIALVAVNARSEPADLVFGSGIVNASSSLCAHPPAPAPAHVALRAATEESPISEWDVVVKGVSAIGCPIVVASACSGKGTLWEGVVFEACNPPGTTGSLTEMLACTPGPMAPPPVLHGIGTLHAQDALGAFDGAIDLTFTGRAAAEAPNPCG